MEPKLVKHFSILNLSEDERKKAEARFWAKVEKTDSCWNWKGAKSAPDTSGYGLLWIAGRNYQAHRISYELIKGRIAQGLQTDHLCRNRACVNPAHLEAVTQRENVLRGQGITAIHARKTHCPQGHPLIEGNLVLSELAIGKRSCLTCRRIYEKERDKRRRQKVKNLLRLAGFHKGGKEQQ